MKSTEVQTLGACLHSALSCLLGQCTCAEIGLAPSRRVAVREVVAILAPTQASGISSHRFGQD